MRRLAIENADAFILVYSIDNAASFERVRRLRDEILQIKRNQMAAKARSPVPTNGRMRSQTVTAGMPIKDSPVMSAHRKYSVGALYSPKASIRRRSCVDSLSEQLAQQLVRNLQLQKKLFPEQSAPDTTDDRPQSAKSNATIDATLPAEQKLAALRNAWRTDVAKLFGHEKSRSPVAKSYDPTEAKAKCSNGDFISVFSENSNPSEFKSYVKAADVPMTTEEEVMITSDELKHIPIVVVGNKMDLEADRALSKELIETLVTMDWEAGFIECSAKSNLNVSAVFKQLMQRSDLPPIAALAFEERTCRRKSLPAYQSPIARNRLKPKRNSCALS